MITVQQEDFDIGAEIAGLPQGVATSAPSSPSPAPCATDHGSGRSDELEHYPGMTESELAASRQKRARAGRFRHA